MNRITAALYRFLVVYLSVAMVVTSIPLAPRAAYADDAGAVAVESEAQESDSSSDADVDAVDNASSSSEGSSSTTSDQTNNAQDESSSSDTSTSTSSLAQDLSSSATNSDAAKTSPATAEPPSDDSEVDALTYEPTVYEYAKFMPNYYLYPCDADGNVTVEIDEDNPRENSVDGRMVTNLIVDYGVDEVDAQLCADSTNLRSVRFENSSIYKIGLHAFYNCPNLTDIGLSGMTIGTIGKEAFYGCKSLTSLNINEVATIGSMGEAAFAESGLVSTGLDKVVGLTSIPDRAYEGCKALTDTGLDKNTSITSIGVCAFRFCSNLATTGLESNTTVETLGHTCFYGTDLSGGLTLPYNSKIEELPEKAFGSTNLETVFFGCNHAVLINTDTFPKYNMTVMVPAKMIPKYSKGEPKAVWERCNGCLPVPVGKVLENVEISCDPNNMTYEPGDTISLEGMSVELDYPHSVSIWDYEALIKEELGEYLTATPRDGDVFDESMDGQPVKLVYDDGYSHFETQTKGTLQLKKPEPTSFQISYAQTIDKGEHKLMDGVELPDVSGATTIDAGAEVTLDAGALGMLNDNITFKGWYDTESGKYISKEAVCTFTPDKDLSLEARFKLKDYAVHANDAQATDSSQDFAHLSVTAQNCYRNAGETVELSAATDNALFLGWYLGEGDDAYAVSDQLDFTYTVDKADAIVSEDKTDARIEITPRYCAPQANVVLSVDGVDENGQPLGQFLSTGLYGIGSRVTVVAVPMLAMCLTTRPMPSATLSLPATMVRPTRLCSRGMCSTPRISARRLTPTSHSRRLRPRSSPRLRLRPFSLPCMAWARSSTPSRPMQ